MADRPVDLGNLGPDAEGITARMRKICADLGVEYACYASNTTINGELVGLTTYPEGWRAHYLSQGHHMRDPTLTRAVHAVAPVDWSRLRNMDGYAEVFRDASDFAIPQTGLSVPIRGAFGDRGVLTLARRCSDVEWAAQKREIMQQVQLMAAQLHDDVLRSGQVLQRIRQPTLSDREKEILQWTAAGKSQQDIADILNLSSRTVEVHLRSARAKLGALNTAQAVGRAIGLRVIYPI
ncbi:MAG: LuxR family transcriptional regulator [Rhodobacteraceae bacterium]|nr:LuxR family transcriptional regulator [Paracoccaceae bacterium]